MYSTISYGMISRLFVSLVATVTLYGTLANAGASPTDLQGKFTLLGEYGSLCPQTITHTTFSSGGPKIWKMPHNTIEHNELRCHSDGSERAFTLYENSLFFVSDNRIPKSLVDMLSSVGENVNLKFALDAASEPFYIGYEQAGRFCQGGSKLEEGTVSFVFRPFNLLKVKGNDGKTWQFQPGLRYMIVVPRYAGVMCPYSAPLVSKKAAESEPLDSAEPLESVEPDEDIAAKSSEPEAVDFSGDADVELSEPSPQAFESQGLSTTESDSTEGEASRPGPESIAQSREPIIDENNFKETVSDVSDEPSDTSDESSSAESVAESSEEAESGSACFPSDSTVELDDGSHKLMKDLQVGDSVRVTRNAFSKVFMFTHREQSGVNKFIRLRTRGGVFIELSPYHYVYSDSRLVAAKDVKSGDVLETVFGREVVCRTSVVLKRGLYNPQTIAGDIYVNGIRTSTYTAAIEPSAAHALLSPMRTLFSMCDVSTNVLESGHERLRNALSPKLEKH